ncbi:SDR family oxidoreductase [Streptomyces sp. NPDC020096]
MKTWPPRPNGTRPPRVGPLAKELGPKGIRVNAVAPGLVDSPMFRDGKTDQDAERIITQAPMRRLASCDEIADTVAYPLGPDATWVSAQTRRVNGGIG